MQVAALSAALERARAELRAQDAERAAAAAQQPQDLQGARPCMIRHCFLHATSPSNMSSLSAWRLRLGVLLCCMHQVRMGV